MEVQSQYPSAAAIYSPEFLARKAPRLAGIGAAPFSHTNGLVSQLSNLPSTLLPQQQKLINGDTVFSSEPESDLTCNAPASRKRTFLGGSVAHAPLHLNLQKQQPQQQQARLAPVPHEEAPTDGVATCAMAPFSLQTSCDKMRLNQSGVASTSGRLLADGPSQGTSPLREELVSQLYQQSLEIDAFILLENERFRRGLEDARKRHHRALLSAMEQGMLRRLREKEAEIDSASRRNVDLEEKIRQLASENQIWSNVARNNEAVVSGLRATLEQVVLQNAATAILGGAAAAGAGAANLPVQSHDWEEGFGETDCPAPVVPADDAYSCCYGETPTAAAWEAVQDTAVARKESKELLLRGACKACRKRDASVLLLPCRHLCLCGECDAGVDACPVCNAVKTASLHVLIC